MIKAIDIHRPHIDASDQTAEFQSIISLIENKQKMTPLLILSRKAVRENLSRLSGALPGIGIRYAVKANNHPDILREVALSGFSFDVASCHEVQSSAEAGGQVAEFIHSHPIKSFSEIEKAINAGISLFVVDNPDEIDKFVAYADRVKLLIRFRIDDSSAVVNLAYKFGCAPEEVDSLAAKMRALGIKYHGLTFHVGSQCLDPSIYIRAIKTASAAIERLKNCGYKTYLLDIGGGFPIPYTNEVPSIEIFCRTIKQELKRQIDPDIPIICEPGRVISATAVTLAASIVGKSKRHGRPWYFLDDGLYGSFSGRLYDHCVYQVLTNRNTTWRRSVLAGPTCDSFDVIYKDIILPPLEIGDILMFPAMGAYCSVSASAFNCLRGAEYIVVD